MNTRAPLAWLILGFLCLACRAQAAAAEENGYSAAALYNSANAYARAGKPVAGSRNIKQA